MKFGIGLTILLLYGCGYTVNPIPSDSVPLGGPGTSGATVDYATVNANVFQPNCVRCHSQAGGNKGGINLETFAQVKSRIQLIASAVNSGIMPPSGTISASAKQKLNDWIASGAPETANSPGGTAPPGTPILPCDDDSAVDDCPEDVY